MRSELEAALIRFLNDPVISVSVAPAEELARLREELAALKFELRNVTSKYGAATFELMEAQERLRDAGIDIKKRR